MGLSLLCMVLFYAANYLSADPHAPADLINRELNSATRLWLNGKLGFFFNFHFNGPVVFLVIPLYLIWFMKKNNRYIPEYRFMLFFVFFMCLFISNFAYINYRYITSLLPVFLWLILLSLRGIYDSHSAKEFLWFLSIISVLHTSFFITSELSPRYFKKLGTKFDRSPSMGSAADFWKTVDDSCASSRVLVNNLPEFYLHSHVNSIFCWIGGNVYYDRNGMHALPENLSAPELRKQLRLWKCNYILSTTQLNEYAPEFRDFLNTNCTTVSKHPDGKILYRIHEN